MVLHSEKVFVKGTELEISRLGLGTAPLGGLFKSVSEAESDLIINTALDSGITYIDTAPLYGYGTGERRVGRGIRKNGGRPAISTKVGRLFRPGVNEEFDKYPDADPKIQIYFDYSPAGIRQSLMHSLERLGLDSVQIVYIHDADEHIKEAIDDVFPVLEELRSQGIIKAIGIGMNWLKPAIELIRNLDLNIALIAGRYTLLDQSAGEELYPLALERNVSIVAAGVYNSGVLANPVAGAHFDYAPASPKIIEKAKAIKDFLADYKVSLTAAALQFPLRHSAVASVITGAGSNSELVANIKDFDTEIPSELWSNLQASGLIEGIA